MRRRLSAWSRVFLVTVGTSLGAIVAGVFVVERFPWQTVYSDFSLARASQFLTPWPQPALDEELQDRKRLRRFAKQEVERRFGIQLRRMETLHTPLFDPFLDPGVQLGMTGLGTAPQPALRFPWPSFQTGRLVGEPGAQRSVSYFAIPMTHGVQLMEGIGVGVGEEVRFSFPIVKNRRTLDFIALPLSPGTVRGALGQYTWVRNFADSDVHRFQLISIPVNDSTASSLRVTSQTAQFLLLGAVVSQWEKTGRLPVQIASSSPLWKADPALLQMAVPGVEGNDKETDPEADEAAIEAPDAAAGTADAASPAPGAAPEQVASESPSPEASLDKEKEKEKEGARKSESKDIPAGVKLPDPLEQVANPQVAGQGPRTAAVGYNLLLLHLEEVPEDVVTNLDAYAKILPNLTGLLRSSVVSARGGRAASTPLGVFHRTVLADGTDVVATENRLLLKKHLLGRSNFNLYARLRNFGYKVLTVAPARFLGLPEGISAGREVPVLDRRWLGASDWPFAQRNKELEEQSQPATGLDAIFQTNTSPLAPPLADADLERVGAFIGEVGRGEDLFADWRANEVFLPDDEGLYLPGLVDFLQKWTKDNTQARFLVHAYLDTRVGATRASMKDLFQVAKAKRFGAFASGSESERLARLALLDRSIGQILSTLKVRKLTHRTLIGLLMPHGKDGTQRSLSASIHIPGVVPRAEQQQGTTTDDFVATLLTAVGIPLGRNVKDSVTPFPGAVWELPSQKEQPRESAAAHAVLRRYVVYLRSGETGCAPISWRTDEDVFGFESSQPVVEFPDEGGREHFRIFPCSLPGRMVRLSWFQTQRVPGTGDEEREGESERERAADPKGGSPFPGRASDAATGADGFSVEKVVQRKDKSSKDTLGKEPPGGPGTAGAEGTLRGFFAVRHSPIINKGTDTISAPDENEMPLFFFGRNALRLGALPMTLASLSEREVLRLFDVDEREVPDARLAADMLELSEFNRGVDRPGAFNGQGKDRMRSAVLVFRHTVNPSETNRLAQASKEP